MSKTVIKVENLSKQYRLGEIGTGSLNQDLKRTWAKLRGKEDPFLKVGETNDRSVKGDSEFVWALKDLNFEIEQGDVLGIIGRNGAGKSTLLKILSKTTLPTTGSVKINGRLASLLEVGTGFHPDLSGRDNIFLNGAILGMTKKEIKVKFDEIVDFAGIERYIDTPVKRYSSGMYVRLAFAVAAYLDPEILIVDEVLAVGDLDFQKKAIGKMKSVSQDQGRTVLFVSHSMAAVRNLCSTGIVMRNGTLLKSGTAKEMIDYYLENYVDFSIDTVIQVEPKHRLYDLSRKIEFTKVAFYNPYPNNQYSIADDIEISVSLISSFDIDSFRISFSINNMEGSSIGVFFSKNNLSLIKDFEKEFKVRISNHQLAKGQYYFNFSTGIGDEVNGVSEYDNVSKTLFFEIAFKDKDRTEMISLWPSDWGNLSFQNVTIA